MTQTYTQRRKTEGTPERAETRAAGPSVSELAAGAAPTNEQMGSRVDLPDAIREKMEGSFGADFSNVRLYESETVADAGAEAVTQGSNIAFAPGQLDLTSTAGQALLGHELSHVVSQSRGESAGRGFLNDAHLEAQADTQGMLAAQGKSACSGPVSPVGASSTASAAGPMQAKKPRGGGRERAGGRSRERAGGGLGARVRSLYSDRFGAGRRARRNGTASANAPRYAPLEDIDYGAIMSMSDVPLATPGGQTLTEAQRYEIAHGAATADEFDRR